MPPFLILTAAAAGMMFGAKAVTREWRRINRELEDAERADAASGRDLRPTLRRDPSTGEWRPQ